MSNVLTQKQLKQYENGALRFTDREDFDEYDRHLVFDHVVSEKDASQRLIGPGMRSLCGI